MGQPEGTAQGDLSERPIPVWATTLGVLILLATAASWLTSAHDAIHAGAFEARLRAAGELERADRLAEAAVEFRHALEIRSGSFPARLGLARCLTRLQRWPEAEQHLIQLNDQRPEAGEVHLLLARTAARRGDRTSAARHYQQSVYGYWGEGEDSQRLRAHWEWVRWLETNGQRDLLFAEVLRLKRQLPPEAPEQGEIPGLLLRAGRPSEAADAFRLTIVRDRRNFDLWMGLGEAELGLGRLPEARRAYGMATSLRKDSAEARDRYQLLTAAYQLDPAMRRLSRAEREARATRLLELTREHLNSCIAPMGEAARREAATLLSRKPERGVEDRLESAEALWSAANRLCPPLGRTQSPLPLVFEALARVPE
jgi:tetratricopeptide (TPR) repeat protein